MPGTTFIEVRDCEHPEVNGESLQKGKSTDLLTAQPDQISFAAKVAIAVCAYGGAADLMEVEPVKQAAKGKCNRATCRFNKNFLAE